MPILKGSLSKLEHDKIWLATFSARVKVETFHKQKYCYCKYTIVMIYITRQGLIYKNNDLLSKRENFFSPKNDNKIYYTKFGGCSVLMLMNSIYYIIIHTSRHSLTFRTSCLRECSDGTSPSQHFHRQSLTVDYPLPNQKPVLLVLTLMT